MNVVVTGDVAEHRGRDPQGLATARSASSSTRAARRRSSRPSVPRRRRSCRRSSASRSTWSQEGDVGLAAEVGVVIDVDGAGQRAVDERFGPGMVKLFPGLRPVSE